MATGDLLPLRRLLQEIQQHGIVNLPLNNPFNTTKLPTLVATQIFEDSAFIVHRVSQQ
jgi:hypothetical protein